MKKLKKLSALFVVVAMLASMSVTVLADGATITAGTPVVEKLLDAKYDYWRVTVPYTSSGVGELGVTLLSFVRTDGNVGEDEPYNENDPTLKVVAIAQEKVGENGAGTIELRVTEFNSGGDLCVVPGKTNIVWLGGDGVTAPDAVTFTIPKTDVEWALVEDSADIKDVDEAAVNVTVAEGKLEDVAAVKAAIARALNGKFVEVALEDSATDDTKADDTTASIALNSEWITEPVLGTGTYTASVVVPAETELAIAGGGTFTLDADQTIAISGTITEGPSFIRGDVDGDTFITALDSGYLMAYFLDNYDIEEGTRAYSAADIDGDGYITALDSGYLLAYFLDNYDLTD